MRREFKVNKIKCMIVNRNTGNMEINKYNQKYEVRCFSQKYNGWTRLCSCMTISEGREKAVQILSLAI